MTHRIAINGYGRIGQSVLRALYESGYRQSMEIVAVNELADAETIAYLTRYDTTHGRFRGEVSLRDGQLMVNGDRIRILREEDPARAPWADIGVDLVLECTGAFSDRMTAEKHLRSGASRVLFSQPAEADVDYTVVYGINQDGLRQSHRIVSNASCTTNCIVPIIKVLDDNLGVERGVITTIHSAMNDQPVIDAYHHHDLRRTRSAMASIIPVNTGLAKGIERLLPSMVGKFEANAVRVPIINVSMMDLTVCVSRETDMEEVNGLLKAASQNDYTGILGFSEEPLASCDFNHDPRSGVVDANQTKVSGGRLIKIMAWFDNEWGFANRMLDTSAHWLSL
ncbi:type I glyceraldehyde-3-phosphate dehydrogenase [Hahella sp. KA22]|uniref:type I glyceraldehyde-3-phosphate dehydrogenase n=1 Tax=Hahella sp. KA22 TaxID=1628392 RepID=UPI000FDD154D|nr:type I glyceraldehyde-3-phosphate dehydrogenase [Hahella sp. KA22]AZZ93885.1 type I glyceraldehyde-3-phosphate dehydrogenase [Hahella sp. KA22]QAY57258.1 type I glyceraldehyde-3-phosphate dehydrogenase [Hahella sp. KA22]